MSFQEIDNQPTELGRISLRRRFDLTLQTEVHEVKIDDEYLMSSLFTAAEVALATRAVARLEGDDLTVAVGGLGLGHTACAALDDARVTRVDVVEKLAPVIDWHREGLVPNGLRLAADERCRLLLGDFFDTVGAGHPVAGGAAEYDAILVDIDHAPANLLSERHAGFYRPDGLARAASLLRVGGVFGLWADGEPDERFLDSARQVFADIEADIVTFPNPYTGGTSSSTVYLGARVGERA